MLCIVFLRLVKNISTHFSIHGFSGWICFLFIEKGKGEIQECRAPTYMNEYFI